MSFFVTPNADGGYNLTAAGYTGLVIIMIAVLLLGVFIFGRNTKFTAKHIAFSAMGIALATVTSMIEIIHFPMGGAVTLLSMLFITMIGYWYGAGVGISAALAYGLLQLIIDPYILSLPQLLLDYIFAFGALGISGFFSSKKNGLTIGYIAGVLGRYFFSFLSGWIFFGIYAADYGFKSPVIYSLTYNGIYLGAEAAITLVVINIPAVRKGLAKIKGYALN